jgi:hypothetical protein
MAVSKGEQIKDLFDQAEELTKRAATIEAMSGQLQNPESEELRGQARKLIEEAERLVRSWLQI